ncbi:hypothetical protein T265_06980 [Opisthorchis viverrini]|uniref:Uncharacterized protein n=1 Tax=Opisthorchis viverrini TaxID=6198 RepID=A0A074ZIF4_OPIVI|nr:hypothetical protein T265_06980 [Opisthorchis viverrini]KER25577.1 hypothetical protein T265_06980 [Opisthorchis viverrini]
MCQLTEFLEKCFVQGWERARGGQTVTQQRSMECITSKLSGSDRSRFNKNAKQLGVKVRWPMRLECEFTDRKVHVSNPISVSRLPLSRFGQSGSIPALMRPSALNSPLFIGSVFDNVRTKKTDRRRFPYTLKKPLSRLNKVISHKGETHLKVLAFIKQHPATIKATGCPLLKMHRQPTTVFALLEPQGRRNRSWAVDGFSATL